MTVGAFEVRFEQLTANLVRFFPPAHVVAEHHGDRDLRFPRRSEPREPRVHSSRVGADERARLACHPAEREPLVVVSGTEHLRACPLAGRDLEHAGQRVRRLRAHRHPDLFALGWRVRHQMEPDTLAAIRDGLHHEERAQRRQVPVPEAGGRASEAEIVFLDRQGRARHPHVDRDVRADPKLGGGVTQRRRREVFQREAREHEVDAVAERFSEGRASIVAGSIVDEVFCLDASFPAAPALLRAWRHFAALQQRGRRHHFE